MNKVTGNKKQEKLPLFSIKLLMILCALLLALAVFGFIAHEIVIEKEHRFDAAILNFLSPYNSASLRKYLEILTWLGDTEFLLPAYLVITLLLFLKKKTRYAINVIIMSLSAYLLVRGVKFIFKRERPQDPFVEPMNDFSFPSGHTVSSFVFFTILIYIIWKLSMPLTVKWIFSILFFLLALTVGLSRIMLGVHYPSDVVAGFSLGAAWVIICSFILSGRKAEKIKEALDANSVK